MTSSDLRAAACAAAALCGSLSGIAAAGTTPGGRIAEHAVCRALFSGDGTAQVVCYLAFVDGLPGPFFSGGASEATAFLTLRTDAVAAQPIQNGNTTVFLQSAGTYNVYFNASPHGDWNDPDSFSSGALVATFERTPPLLVNVGPMANGFFSAELAESVPFDWNGQRVDFKRLVPGGVTWVISASTTLLPGPPGFVAAQAFAGSALAVAGTGPRAALK